jgi:hypothetical protein
MAAILAATMQTIPLSASSARTNELPAGTILKDMGSAALTLDSLTISRGTLSPSFSPSQKQYYTTVSSDTTEINVTPVLTPGSTTATITVNGTAATTGTASTVPLAYGDTKILIVISKAASTESNTYTLTVKRIPLCAITDLTATVNDKQVDMVDTSAQLDFKATATSTNSSDITYKWYACDADGNPADLGEDNGTIPTTATKSSGGSVSYSRRFSDYKKLIYEQFYYFYCVASAPGAADVKSDPIGYGFVGDDPLIWISTPVSVEKSYIPVSIPVNVETYLPSSSTITAGPSWDIEGATLIGSTPATGTTSATLLFKSSSTNTINVSVEITTSNGITSEYTAKIHLREPESASVYASFDEDQTAHDFGSSALASGVPAAKTVTVTNVGNKTVTLVQPASTSEFLIGTLSKTTLAPYEKATFTVQPKTSLPANSYQIAIPIKTDRDLVLLKPDTASFTRILTLFESDYKNALTDPQLSKYAIDYHSTGFDNDEIEKDLTAASIPSAALVTADAATTNYSAYQKEEIPSAYVYASFKVNNTYAVNLPTGAGYTAGAESGSTSPVEVGKDYSFHLTLDDNYLKSTAFAVKANGTVLNEENGVYTIKNITEVQNITVEGVVLKDADYSKVNDALAKIPSDLTKYTAASVKALTDAKAAVVLGKNITDQAAVDGYASAIEKAVAALQEKTPLQSVTISGLCCVGQKLSAVISPSQAEATYEWIVDGKTVGTDSTYTISQDTIGQKVTLKVTGSGDYTGTAQAVTENVIAPAATDADVATVSTGDHTNIAFYASMLLVSLACALYLMKKRNSLQ